ncbi:MAG: primosomal protein N' [Chthoniobacterales bacterium]|nr:primosomal protein N' [Chthoniobacterales bacterium]
MPRFAQVILDRSTGKELDYEIPAGWEARIAPGSRVRVPLRNRQVIGTVMSVSDTTAAKGVRPIASVMDERPQMTPVLMRLAKWMADYYACDEQDALRCILPRAVRKTGHAPLKRNFAALARKVSAEEIAALRVKAPRQAAIVDHLQTSGPLPVAKLTAETGSSDAALRALARRGMVSITSEEVRRAPLASHDFVASKPPKLSAEQEQALERLRPALCDPAKHKPVVLKGITGSGKTEVYLRAIAEVLDAGKTALVLVPEISLTPQTVERFSSRFAPEGIEVAVLHSHLSEGERHDEWHRVRDGKARIVIGARGAVFAPLENLGLIVVDEEHDTSYKQDEGPRYHARDLAVVRGNMEPCAVLLGSATPSLESFENCRKGKYELLELTHRHDGCVLPVFRVVDMRLRSKDGERSDQFISPKLASAVEARLAKNEQTILFLNRRGFFTVLACKACGKKIECPHCSVSLALHRAEDRARCHICGYAEKPPRRCPQCHDPQIAFSGVGTEKVEAAVRKMFPQARVARMDSDTMTRKNAYHETLGSFRARKIDILVGTQMIAKGLHFPGVTLVGIISADSALHLPDFRAGERTFQLLVQVAGRAGRGDAEGEVIVQTFTPSHPSLQFAKSHDFDGFAVHELEMRKNFGHPPFSHLVLITARADTEQKAEFASRTLAQKLSAAVPPSVMVSPAAPAPLARVRGMYRYQVVARGKQIRALTQAIKDSLKAIKLPKDTHVVVDVDPMAVL